MMRLRKASTLLLLGVILTVLPRGAPAQVIPSPFEFLEKRQEAGVFLGQMAPGVGRFGYGPKSSLALGARYGIHLSGPFGLEAVGTMLPTDRDLIDPGRDEGDRVIGDVPATLISLDGRLRFSLTGDRTWHGVAPFLFTGGGLVFDVAGDDEAEEDLLADDRFEFGTSFLGLLGGGLRWFPGDRLVVRFEGALSLWQLKSPRGFRDPEREFEGVEEKEWVSGPSFSVGIGFRF